MARPKRMGAYNALDDLRPGRAWLEPVPDPGPSALDDPAPQALDDLLPGPRGLSALDELLPGPSTTPAPGQGRPGPAPRARRVGRHLGVWNPLDDLPPPAPDPARAKARVGFRLSADLAEAARDAVAFLAATGDRTTLSGLTERALRAELARLADRHHRGRPFPPRTP